MNNFKRLIEKATTYEPGVKCPKCKSGAVYKDKKDPNYMVCSNCDHQWKEKK